MDNLSLLLGLSQTHVQPDAQCLLAGSFVIDHEHLPEGQASFHLLLSGQCQVHLHHNALLHLRAGDFLLLTHGQGHTVLDALAAPAAPRAPRAIRTVPAPGLAIKCSPDIEQAHDTLDMLCGRFIYAPHASTSLTQALAPVLHVNLQCSAEMGTLQTLIALLRTEASGNQPGADAIVNALGQTLLTMALRVYAQTQPESAGLLSLACDARIGPSIQAMLREPQRNWRIETLGQIAAMSRATYARQFKNRTGFTVGSFLQRIRVLHASTLMRHTGRSLGSIALHAGYQSEAAFGKAFKRIMGQTPGRWRRQLSFSQVKSNQNP